MVKNTEHGIPYVAFLVDYLEYGYRVQKLWGQKFEDKILLRRPKVRGQNLVTNLVVT